MKPFSGDFNDSKAPYFDKKYLKECKKGAINLDKTEMGFYPFCSRCHYQNWCIEDALGLQEEIESDL